MDWTKLILVFRSSYAQAVAAAWRSREAKNLVRRSRSNVDKKEMWKQIRQFYKRSGSAKNVFLFTLCFTGVLDALRRTLRRNE